MRRTLDRPKIYWRHPGLCLWLSGQMTGCPEGLRRSLFENAVYLALTDIYPQATFAHFADTNHVTCPLVVEVDGQYRAFYICENDVQRELSLRHHKSLVKTGRGIDRVRRTDSPGADNIRRNFSCFSKALKKTLRKDKHAKDFGGRDASGS